MRRHPYWRFLPVLLMAALAWSPAAPVTAQGPQPPAPTVHLAAPGPQAPAQPDACADCLYDQNNTPFGSVITSQDSTANQYDTQAADDFFINPAVNSWQITAVEVVGQFIGSGAPPYIDVVNVALYADEGGRPGFRLFAQAVHPISGTATTGNFFLPLSPVAHLGSNATYWVSVQAHQIGSPNWYWAERAIQAQSASVWKNPANGYSSGCLDWTTLKTCFPSEGPDLQFRLHGTTSTSHVTPVLLSINPNAAIHRTFSLAAHGVGFASGATLDWSLGNKHFTTTVSSSIDLHTTILAADVPGPFQGTVSVSVTNPGPCAGSCTSNALTFTMANRTYLPLIRR